MTGRVVVVGSLNLDIVLQVAALPMPGETVMASARSEAPGGKGGNQAAAAARAGATTIMVGSVGDDEAGRTLTGFLRGCGADVSQVTVRSEAATGSALVLVCESGENSIVVCPGANELVSVEGLELTSDDILVLQQEVAPGVVKNALELAGECGATSMLSCAPSRDVPQEVLDMATGLLVNAGELAALLNDKPPSTTDAIIALARRVPRAPDQWLIVTLGSQGAVLLAGGSAVHVPAMKVTPVDTTGAGDCLAGVTAAALCSGLTPGQALARGVAGAAISVTRPGAGPSMPTGAEIDAAVLRS